VMLDASGQTTLAEFMRILGQRNESNVVLNE